MSKTLSNRSEIEKKWGSGGNISGTTGGFEGSVPPPPKKLN